MKKVLTLLFLFFVISFQGFIAMAQSPLRSVKFTLDSINNKIWIPNSNTWDKDYFRTAYNYDNDGNLTESIIIGWSGLNNTWSPYNKNEFSFDSDGNKISHINYSWSVNNGWSEVYKQENNFDFNGGLLKSIDYIKNHGSGQWDKQWKTINSYNSLGKLIGGLVEVWNISTTQWENWENWEYYFDSNENLSNSIKYSWNLGTNQWDSVRVVDNDYDSMDNLIFSEIFSKDPITGIWELDIQENYVYNQNGQVVDFERVNYVIHLKSRKNVYIYDSNFNTTQINEQQWDTNIGAWVNLAQKEFNYDNTYNNSELIVPDRYNENHLMNHMLLDQTTYNWKVGTSTFVEYEKIDFIYSLQNINTIEEQNEPTLLIYPNPCMNYFSVTANGTQGNMIIEIFDSKGIRVLSSVLFNNTPISIEDLSNGTYFYYIESKEGYHQGKIIKE